MISEPFAAWTQPLPGNRRTAKSRAPYRKKCLKKITVGRARSFYHFTCDRIIILKNDDSVKLRVIELFGKKKKALDFGRRRVWNRSFASGPGLSHLVLSCAAELPSDVARVKLASES
jgi:hypothetical protein